VHVTQKNAYPGGAANVARNLALFCENVSLLGVTGTCAEAAELMRLLEKDHIGTHGVLQDPGQKTIVKTRVVARSQHVVRIDFEQHQPLSPETQNWLENWLEAHLSTYDAVILEDYAKGLFSQKLVDAVAQRIERGRQVLTVDPNPGNPLHWHAATTVKPNRKEAYQAAGLPDPGNISQAELLQSLPELAQRLFSLWQTENLLITLGEHGMAHLCQPVAGAAPQVYHTPTRAPEVFDVSGAGDTAIAFYTLALASGATLEQAAELSNLAAGIVVGKLGTATVSMAELERACREF
jgi:D-beta-D-heptose 7-phosphate kinase/D-beta-D-heptose 1-phosphate adenosyltransferase